MLPEAMKQDIFERFQRVAIKCSPGGMWNRGSSRCFSVITQLLTLKV